ncbi:MAG: response regulator [Planctomycetota bacterium]
MKQEPAGDPRSSKAAIECLLDGVMASCRDAIIGCDLDGSIEVWNPAATELYRLRRTEAIGMAVHRLVSPDRHDELQRLIESARQGRVTDTFDTVRVTPGGDEFPVSVCGFPLRDGSGHVVGFATVERDISERVRSAEALRSALNEAVEANSAKSRFLANASHELRTPMNAIVGMTALALEEELSPELRDYLETIRDSADSMLHLINDVLDLSKFESARFELEETNFNLRELVESTIKVLGSAAHAKGLELVSRIDRDVPTSLVGDAARLRQVVTNLVGNAIKFTASGEVVVEVCSIASEEARCLLEISVADTGIGISKEDRDRIFAPFTQVDGAVTRKYTGTGLGLTISQHLIECFGGSLNVESELGSGSRFSFRVTLPINCEHRSTTADTTAEHLRGMSVLVVDDNETSRASLVEQLASWNMRAEAVGDGQTAIAELRRRSEDGSPFDLTVVDALMPGTDGFRVAEAIGGDARIPTKPILMASTTDRLEFSRRCAEAGAAGFVQKPISQSQLLGAVAQAAGAATLESEERSGLFDRPAVTPLSILLVEDTPANRKVVEKVLTRRGHSISVAVNGREAIDAFKEGCYDLVLMDVQMPIMDGFQATEALREIERKMDATTVPIIAMTAHSMRGDRQRCLRAGMNGYLSKPVDLSELIRTVEEHSTRAAAENGAVSEEGALADVGKIVDLEAALSRLRGDRELLLDMMRFFVDDAPGLLVHVQAHIKDGEFNEARRAAHSLKGLAATFDAIEAVAAARDVEIACEGDDHDDLEDLVSTLVKACNRLVEWLQDYRDANRITDVGNHEK